MTTNDFAAHIRQTATDQAHTFRAGMDASPAQAKLDAIVRAYELTKDDHGTRIPTALMCAIEAARK